MEAQTQPPWPAQCWGVTAHQFRRRRCKNRRHAPPCWRRCASRRRRCGRYRHAGRECTPSRPASGRSGISAVPPPCPVSWPTGAAFWRQSGGHRPQKRSLPSTPASGSPKRPTGPFGRRLLPPSPPGRALDLRPQPPSTPHTWACFSTAKPHAAAKSRPDRPVPGSRRQAEKMRESGKKDTNGHTWTSQARTAPPRRFRRSTQPPDQAASCFAALRLVVSSSEPAHQPALLPAAGCQPSSAYRPPTKHHHHQPAPRTAIGECAGRKGPQGPPDTDHSTPDLLRWPTASVSGLP